MREELIRQRSLFKIVAFLNKFSGRELERKRAFTVFVSHNNFSGSCTQHLKNNITECQ